VRWCREEGGSDWLVAAPRVVWKRWRYGQERVQHCARWTKKKCRRARVGLLLSNRKLRAALRHCGGETVLRALNSISLCPALG